ncbi:DNA-3-methyladenine glycosylase 2 family protein [candidate division WWE3 bacterium]|nr:DNA-3-methyladenine glycosylase 2 family protein [candidate division WWE3 bacterium]
MSKAKYTRILNHFESNDPAIYELMKSVDFDEWFTPNKNPKNEKDYFHALCREIIGQQLSGKAANSIYKRFAALLENRVTPENILKTQEQKFRDVGMSWAKARYVRDLALKVKEKKLKLGGMDRLDDAEVIKNLIEVKGIGEWTAEMFLIFTLNRGDVFSFGDLGLRKGFEKVYKKRNPTKKQMEKVISKWSPYKTYGSITLWHSLESDKV